MPTKAQPTATMRSVSSRISHPGVLAVVVGMIVMVGTLPGMVRTGGTLSAIPGLRPPLFRYRPNNPQTLNNRHDPTGGARRAGNELAEPA